MPFKKGTRFSEEHKKRISESRKANPHHTSTEFKPGHIPWTKNRHLSEPCRIKISESKKGHRNPNWKGGKRITRQGYVLILKREHSFAHKIQGTIFEHRLVAEKILGRPLKRAEVVHHKNGIRSDNRLENIEIFFKGQHSALHNKLRKRSSSGEEPC